MQHIASSNSLIAAICQNARRCLSATNSSFQSVLRTVAQADATSQAAAGMPISVRIAPEQLDCTATLPHGYLCTCARTISIMGLRNSSAMPGMLSCSGDGSAS